MTNDLILIYSGYFICSIILAVLLNVLFLRFSRTMGIRNTTEHSRWSTMQKPAIGGISFFFLFLLSIACYTVFFPYRRMPLDTQLLGLLGAVTIAFIMGLADDAYNTKPVLKLFVQICCAVILIWTGQGIHLFAHEIYNEILTVVWVVGIMNSINMLDNMDAISATVSVIILLESLLSIYASKDFYHVHIIIILGTLAGLSGFLFFNWNPSKLFMGDTGSQFLGILLATFGMKYFWNSTDFGGNVFHTKQIMITLLAFLVPICDTSIVTINRILKKRAPWVGGKDHTTHHLSYLGFSDSQVAMTFAGISIVSLMMIFVIQGTIVNWGMKHILLFGSYILIVFGTLFAVTKVSKQPLKNNEQDLKKSE